MGRWVVGYLCIFYFLEYFFFTFLEMKIVKILIAVPLWILLINLILCPLSMDLLCSIKYYRFSVSTTIKHDFRRKSNITHTFLLIVHYVMSCMTYYTGTRAIARLKQAVFFPLYSTILEGLFCFLSLPLCLQV